MSVDGFVLVHGGFHGAWCWDPVLPLLERPAIAVDLPGRGERPAPERTVTVDECVEAVLDDADARSMDRFVLVGHSMGGITITETANRHPGRIAGLVYVAALVLEPGATVWDLYFPDGTPPPDDRSGVMPLLDEPMAHQLFAADIGQDEFAAAHRRCVPEPLGLFNATVSGYTSGVPATYVRCERDQAVSAEATDQMLDLLAPGAVRRLDSDHDVMLSHPAELATILNEVARAS